MTTRDDWIWQQASELMEHAERIHRCFYQAALSTLHSAAVETSWAPPVTIVETSNAIWVIYALPGVSAEQMSLSIEKTELVLTGHRPLPACCREGEIKFMEIPFGSFSHRLRLPQDSSFVLGEVRYEEGLILIQLRKV